MTNLIREKRRLPFSFKRIGSATIRSLSQLIEEEAANARTSESDYYLLYSIDAADSTSFESATHEIFKEQYLMDTKVIQRVVMRFYTLDNSRNIEVQIVHSISNENSDNFISVSGNDSTWVNGILNRLSEIVSRAENQPKTNSRYGGYILLALFVLTNVEYYRLFLDYINSMDGVLSVIALFGFFPLSAYLCIKISNELDRIYPAIELQTGAIHMQYQQQRRKSLQWWAATVIIPLLLALIYDMVKGLL